MKYKTGDKVRVENRELIYPSHRELFEKFNFKHKIINIIYNLNTPNDWEVFGGVEYNGVTLYALRNINGLDEILIQEEGITHSDTYMVGDDIFLCT